MEIRRTFFVDSVSSSAVQLRRWPTLNSMDDTCGGRQIHQANLVIGLSAATTAEAGSNAFWKADCTRYEVTVRRLT
jgi:hypothetical protein